VVARPDLGDLGDAPGQGGLDEEMLSEPLPGTDPVTGGQRAKDARRQTGGS
jgi:hypothetical protein